MTDRFDQIIEPEPGIEYGVFKGWQNYGPVFFIKMPSGENFHKQGNKYYRMSKELSKRTHCTVICAENHTDEISKKYDIEVIRQYLESFEGKVQPCRVIGIGDGAKICLSWLCHNTDVEKMLLVNVPISYELGETVEILNAVDKKNIKFVYGDGDPSYRFTPLLRRLYADVSVLPDVDHNFKGRMHRFVSLQALI